MKLGNSTRKRNIWDRIWYPKEEDVIGFRVLQMISLPIIMLLNIVLAIFTKNSKWVFLMLSWFILSLLLWIFASVRFRMIKPPKKN